jgi:hypothetical protein
MSRNLIRFPYLDKPNYAELLEIDRPVKHKEVTIEVTEQCFDLQMRMSHMVVEHWKRFGDEPQGFFLGPVEYMMLKAALVWQQQYAAGRSVSGGEGRDGIMYFHGLPVFLGQTNGVSLVVPPKFAVRLYAEANGV